MIDIMQPYHLTYLANLKTPTTPMGAKEHEVYNDLAELGYAERSLGQYTRTQKGEVFLRTMKKWTEISERVTKREMRMDTALECIEVIGKRTEHHVRLLKMAQEKGKVGRARRQQEVVISLAETATDILTGIIGPLVGVDGEEENDGDAKAE